MLKALNRTFSASAGKVRYIAEGLSNRLKTPYRFMSPGDAG